MRPNGGRQGKIFKMDTSKLPQIAFLSLIKAFEKIEFSAILRDFLNLYEVKYNRISKTIFYFNPFNQKNI